MSEIAPPRDATPSREDAAVSHKVPPGDITINHPQAIHRVDTDSISSVNSPAHRSTVAANRTNELQPQTFSTSTNTDILVEELTPNDTTASAHAVVVPTKHDALPPPRPQDQGTCHAAAHQDTSIVPATTPLPQIQQTPTASDDAAQPESASPYAEEAAAEAAAPEESAPAAADAEEAAPEESAPAAADAEEAAPEVAEAE